MKSVVYIMKLLCRYRIKAYMSRFQREDEGSIPFTCSRTRYESKAHLCKPEIAFKIKNWGYLMIVDPLLLRITVVRN